MRRFLWAFGAVMFVSIGQGERASADPKFPQGDARRSMGNLAPNSARFSGRSSLPQYRYGYSYSPSYGSGGYHYRPQYRRSYRPYDYYRGPYDYDGYRYGYPYPTYYRRYYYSYPVLPAELLYGPEAVKRFMGFGGGNRLQPNVNNILVAPGRAGARADAAAVPQGVAEPRRDLQAANQRVLALAWKYIGYGDAHYANQKYSDAYLRYRKAAQAAPGVADVHFRQGFALLAMGRYELAAKALKRGLQLDAAWPRSGFELIELYGDDVPIKKAQVDALAKTAEQNPRDADLLFLLGVFLHFDGQQERAVPFFERAKQLNVGNDDHLSAFLGP